MYRISIVGMGILGISTFGALLYYVAQAWKFFLSGQFIMPGSNPELNSIAISFGIVLTVIGIMMSSLYGLSRITE